MVTDCDRLEKLYVFEVFAIFIKLFSLNIPKYKVFAMIIAMIAMIIAIIFVTSRK